MLMLEYAYRDALVWRLPSTEDVACDGLAHYQSYDFSPPSKTFLGFLEEGPRRFRLSIAAQELNWQSTVALGLNWPSIVARELN
ncbi:hypothetical protein GW17_00037674 [Ensete ventricosum]|nr:hypothetical protein GW17_00037674 [Ensete ventricosum]